MPKLQFPPQGKEQIAQMFCRLSFLVLRHQNEWEINLLWWYSFICLTANFCNIRNIFYLYFSNTVDTHKAHVQQNNMSFWCFAHIPPWSSSAWDMELFVEHITKTSNILATCCFEYQCEQQNTIFSLLAHLFPIPAWFCNNNKGHVNSYS